ncbi:MAG: hypothetical protein ACD_73C00472G0001 [uncultured bacterium]|nr:MAG: hypothetical protein ACD_73C00472G0001 [uncultured bacterium]
MSAIKTNTTYLDSGVNIDEGDAFVEAISPMVKKTRRPGVMGNLGGYAGLFSLDLSKYPQPVLASTTDGVGTKLKIAFEMETFDSIGIDLVAMCVNDLICCGAKPLFFLDYFATGKLSSKQGSEVLKGICQALEEVECALTGGETAEMPGLYQAGEFDLAGFAVGVVNHDKIIDGSKVKKGHKILGLASSGIHSNGFSLVRKIIAQKGFDLKVDKGGFDQVLGNVLLTPTKLYVKSVLKLLASIEVLGLAHITGGGLPGNVPRMIPDGLKAVIHSDKINKLPIFQKIQEWGNVTDAEMWKVFNMGIGLCLIIEENNVAPAQQILSQMGESSNVIGTIEEGMAHTEAFVEFK